MSVEIQIPRVLISYDSIIRDENSTEAFYIAACLQYADSYYACAWHTPVVGWQRLCNQDGRRVRDQQD